MANYRKFYETNIYREEYDETFGLELEWHASLYPVKEKFENYAEQELKERKDKNSYDGYMYWCDMIQEAIDDNATIIEENKKDPRKLYVVMYDICKNLIEKMVKTKRNLPPFFPEDGDYDDRLFRIHTHGSDMIEYLESYTKDIKYIANNFDEYITTAMFSPYRKR